MTEFMIPSTTTKSRKTFYDVFPTAKQQPIILGMIHGAGETHRLRVQRVIEELDIFAQQGVTGVIFENYHCSIDQLISILDEIPLDRWRNQLIYGINVLPNDYSTALYYATKYSMQFIQLDYISGRYERNIQLNTKLYLQSREEYPNPIVLGGVHPKYYHPVEGSNLKDDLMNARELCEAIVVTGLATGCETPFEKIQQFYEIVGDTIPLIVGAGITPLNVQKQLSISQGCIVGSCFKPNGDTYQPIQSELVQQLITATRGIAEK